MHKSEDTRSKIILNVKDFFAKNTTYSQRTSFKSDADYELQKSILVAEFCDYLDAYPYLLSENIICPLLIILTGFWSTNYKKERSPYNPNKIIHQRIRLLYEAYLIQMLEKGADPNIYHIHIHQSTAMHWLIAWDRSYAGVKFIELVKNTQQQWNPNMQDACLRTSLSLLVARKYFGRTQQAENEDNMLITALVKENTNFFIQDDLGNTALHYAFIKRDIFAIQTIINHCEHPQDLIKIKNKDGFFATELSKIPYLYACDSIHKVYVASSSQNMFNKERWHSLEEKMNEQAQRMSKLT